MPIRKGRLWRICERCGESFEPIGRTNKYCNKCKRNNTCFLDSLIAIQNNHLRGVLCVENQRKYENKTNTNQNSN